MEYWIKRGEAQFGPYSLAGLQNYLQSGNLVRDDLARSEGMTDWVPLWQVLGTVPVPQGPVPAPGMAVPSSSYGYTPEAGINQVELPPDLPWWVLLLLEIFTCGLFGVAWGFVLGLWARRLSGSSTALVLNSIYAALIFLLYALSASGERQFSPLFTLSASVIRLVAVFRIRSDMEQYYNTVEKIGLTMSGVMVFFFGGLYLQYHVNSIYSLKKMLVRV